MCAGGGESARKDGQVTGSLHLRTLYLRRPALVVTLLGTRLCRPSEIVLDIQTEGQKGAFTKEDAIRSLTKRGSELRNLSTSEYWTPVYTMRASGFCS